MSIYFRKDYRNLKRKKKINMNLKLLESMHKLELLEKYLIKFKFVYILLILIIIIGFTSQIYIYRK